MTDDARSFGETPEGRPATLHTIQNTDLRVGVTDFGGRLVSIEMAQGAGRWEHVLLGFDNVAQYCTAGGSFGALLGRTANRISGGQFTLDGRTCHLSKNEAGSTLHGGQDGFGKQFWQVRTHGTEDLALEYTSADGDQGFPGELAVRATYRLDGPTLTLSLEATTTKPTPVNLSSHPYFNLAGLPMQDILGHELTINADAFLPTDARQIPTGEIRNVAGTPFDFRMPRAIGALIYQDEPQLLLAKGYDHCFVLNGPTDGSLRFAARARDPGSGRTLDVHTTQPGLQFYSGNNLNGSVSGRGGVYRQAAGFALEAQAFPNAPNQPAFPSTVLRPGQGYAQTIAFAFSVT